MKKNTNYMVRGAICLLLASSANAATAETTNINQPVAASVENTVANDVRKIASVAAVNVESPVGTVPRLPYQIWVTYTDGTSEFRQVKWSNAALATEKEQAQYAAGKEYKIGGYIIGDNTTANGFPIEANIKVVAGEYKVPSNKPVAETLPLGDVSVDGDNRLTSNRNLDIKTILSWDVSQQLYNYRDTYGMSTEGYKVADGWDSPSGPSPLILSAVVITPCPRTMCSWIKMTFCISRLMAKDSARGHICDEKQDFILGRWTLPPGPALVPSRTLLPFL